MSNLPQATCRRLAKVPQSPTVWEVDRRRLTAGLPDEDGAEGDCILWVDGSEGYVRAMDVVPPETGNEAVVRTLLRAIEYPHDPARPARPRKVVVRNRELQFYLRSVLQDLDITIEYVQSLPLVDEIFRSFEQMSQQRPPMLPPEYAESLEKQAMQLWQLAPWEVLGDHEVLAIEVNQWDLTTVYASVMGMLGMEFGILLYRSLDSLKQFRERVVNTDDSMDEMKEVFLTQDCLFLTYEPQNELPNAPFLRVMKPEMTPLFGNLHPLEGMRGFLYEEEAAAFSAMLDGLCRFVKANRRKLVDEFPPLTGRYKIALPDGSSLSLKISTEPELADELYAMADDEESLPPLVRDDLVPPKSFLSLGMMPWDVVELLRQTATHQAGNPKETGEGLPVIVIQTTQPKAKALIKAIKDLGGIQALGFTPGADPMTEIDYDLGVFQTADDTLHLFGEFLTEEPNHKQARKKWNQRCKKTQGYCGLIIAKGLTGATRGKPNLDDMLALYEVSELDPAELGLGLLEKRMLPAGLDL
jgi:hypothetical protein